MTWLYVMTIIWCLFLLYVLLIKIQELYNIKSGNIKSILTLDDNNKLIFSIPFKSKYCEPRELFEFKQNVLFNDPMTGDYYAPGLVPIICDTDEKFNYWKNKLNTCGKVWEWELTEFKKYKEAMYNYLDL